LTADSYPRMTAISFKASGELAEVSARSVLTGLQLFSRTIDEAFDALKRRKLAASAAAVGLEVPPAPKR